MEVQLVQLGRYGDQKYHLTGRECVIGREPSCDLRPDHGRVSKRHTRLFWKGSRLFAEDLNSADGTRVNGEPIDGATEVRDGDELSVGPVTYIVMIATDAAELAARGDQWVDRAVRKHHPERAVGVGPSDSNVIISPAMQTARKILDRIHGDDEEEKPHHEERPERQGLEVDEQSGVALAKILNRVLVDEMDIRRFSHQLDELIAGGKHRIALHFGNVEQCSSQALSTVLAAFERCREAGGSLKICTVNPAVAQLITMINLQRYIEVYPDAEPALDSVWPRPSEPEDAGADALSPGGGAAADPLVRLIVEVGKARGQAIEVKGRRFIIGRDHRCQLRPNSDTISRIHAIIERRDGRVFVRDYGTKNGTILAGRVLRGEEAEAHDGDPLQVGVLRFTLQVLPGAGMAGPTGDEDLAAWLLNQGADEDSPTALMIPTPGRSVPAPPHAPAAPDPSRPETAADPTADLSTATLQCEIVRGTLVARVRLSNLEDEATVGPLRYELQTLFDRPLPRRVVLSLENVQYLSSRAVGVILAFFQHLDREDGSLRVCCVAPKLLPVLDSMRLSSLVETYATVEEAVNDPWI